MTPEQLKALLDSHFPPDATMWSKATDEVPELCRLARVQLRIPDAYSIDFSKLATSPSNWNTQGIKAIICYYEQMDDKGRAMYLETAKSFFPALFVNIGSSN